MVLYTHASALLTEVRALVGELDVERDRLRDLANSLDQLSAGILDRVEELEGLLTTLENEQRSYDALRLKYWVCSRLPEVEGSFRLGILQAKRAQAVIFYGAPVDEWRREGFEIYAFDNYGEAFRWWDACHPNVPPAFHQA